MAPLDQQIQQTLRRITGLIKTGSKPYLLADHLALARMGPLSVKVVKDNNVTYVDNPATHWVLDSFQTRAASHDGADSAKHATSVMNELLKLNEDVDERLTKTQAAIGERIEKVSHRLQAAGRYRATLTSAQSVGRGRRRRRVDQEVPRIVGEAAAHDNHG